MHTGISKFRATTLEAAFDWCHACIGQGRRAALVHSSAHYLRRHCAVIASFWGDKRLLAHLWCVDHALELLRNSEQSPSHQAMGNARVSLRLQQGSTLSLQGAESRAHRQRPGGGSGFYEPVVHQCNSWRRAANSICGARKAGTGSPTKINLRRQLFKSV